MLSTFKSHAIRDRKGSAVVEYAILAGLVAVASVSSVAIYGGHLSSIFSTASEDIASAGDLTSGSSTSPGPSREPWTFPASPSGMGCQIMTNGNDTLLLAADPEYTCYHLLEGVDDFNGAATSKPLAVYTDANAAGGEYPDAITLGEGGDFLDGAGASEVNAGGGDDSIRLDIGVTPKNLDFDMGDGDDILHLSTTGYDDNSPYQRIDVHLQSGNDEALFACDHPTKPPYTVRTWDSASVKSSCRTEIFFDEPGFDTDLEVQMENLTWASGTQFLAPGNIDARYSLTEGNYIFEFHKDVSGNIVVDSVGPDGDKAGLDISFWKHGGAQPNLSMDINGTYHEVNLVLPPELSPNIDLEFGIEVWSTVEFHLGERSVIGDLPVVKMTGSEVRLDFEPWSGATDDDLRLALLDANGAVVFDYDMALASAEASTLTAIDPDDHGVEKIRITRQGKDRIIKINSADADLQVHTIGIRHE